MLKVGVGYFTDGSEFNALVGKGKGAEFAISGNADGSLMPIVTGACANAKLPKGRGMIGFGGSFYPEGDF